MNALQKLNEQLQNRGLGPAEFTYVKTGTDHFPNFQASMVLEGRQYTGEVRGTKKLAARSCAESVTSRQGGSTLILDHTDETIDQLVELSKSHANMCVVTDDAKILSMGTTRNFTVNRNPAGVSRAMMMALTIVAFYNNDAADDDPYWSNEDDGGSILVKTKIPEVIAYVNAMKSGAVGCYEDDWKTISIV